MLRITSANTSKKVTLKLEGSLAGIWVDEFLDAWRSVRCSLAGRDLCIDLADVTLVDKAGEFLLALIRRNGAQLSGSGVMMTDLLQTIARDWSGENSYQREA